jgi:hypothetical protein
MVLVPEAFGPGPVDSFNHVIALRFPRGDEEQFDAQVQREAHEAAEDSGSASQAGERGIVIKLQKIRNA